MQRKYSLNYLLSKQPDIVKKSPDFKKLLIFYKSIPALNKIFINRKCYSLLNNGLIKPENLEYFYKTYRLPKAAFFPLFLKIKSDYFKNKNLSRQKKLEKISDDFRKLDNEILIYIKYFSKYEAAINKSKKIPVWNKTFYPKSHKNALNLLKYNKIKWTDIFKRYSLDLKKKYEFYNDSYFKKLINLFIMELSIKKHTNEEIKSQYRKLSKKHHPDLGGESIIFELITRAKNELLS